MNVNDSAEIFDQITRNRRSVRGFLPTPVSDQTMQRIFTAAAHAPSNCNTQPWQAYVISGETRDRISQRLLDTVGQGETSIDYPYDAKYENEYRQRQLDVGLLLYKALGVTREDKEGKRQAFLRNLKFFGAPHAVFIFIPDWSDMHEAADVGMYAQNLMLAMQANGVASCPQTILAYNPDMVRAELGVDDSLKLLFGISFGYEDKSLPENQIVPDRAAIDASAHFFK
jgi:nitroreductase